MIKNLKRLSLLLSTILFTVGCKSTPQEEKEPEEFIPKVGEIRKLFDHGIAGQDRYYNYCPSVFIENDKEYIYYCTNKNEGNVTDYIGYREVQSLRTKLNIQMWNTYLNIAL